MPTSRRIAVLYLGLFVLCGMVVGLPGPAIPVLAETIGRPKGDFGLMISLQSLGGVIGALVFGLVFERRGHATFAAVVALAAAAVVGLAWSNTFGMVLACALGLGIFGGALDLGGNVFMIRAVRDNLGPWMNALHLFFAVGALATPGIVSASRSIGDSLHTAALVIALLGAVGAVALSMMVTPPLVPKIQSDGRRPPSPRLVALVSMFFFLYVSLEVSCFSWIPSFIEDEAVGGSNAVTIVPTVLLAAFAVGRLASVFILHRVGAWTVLLASCGVALVASGLLLVGHRSYPAILVASALFGFGVAPQYATMLTTAEAAFTVTSRVTSSFAISGSVAVMTIPYLIGKRLNAVGPVALPQALTIMAMLLLGWTWFLRQRLRGDRAPTRSALQLSSPG